MSRVLVQAEETLLSEGRANPDWSWIGVLRGRPIESRALGLAICAVPISIVVCESFLFLALAARIVRIVRGQGRVWFPRVFFFWLAWAGLEVLSWAISPERRSGSSEIRHLMLIATVFILMPTFRKETDR